MKLISTLLVLLMPAMLVAPAIAQNINRTAATVVSTGDGDTLRVNQQGRAVTVRLVCIDAVRSVRPKP
jgi:endonuclease YncB( thermonuclease family)